MRVTGIFTGTTSSPSRSLRQSHDRYAIRAGRNLPDKEFRYLRTVIVTAAVHRGFSSQLHPSCDKLTALFNLPAPGRRQPLYVVFDFAETCVFVKQSPCAFHCGPLELLTLYRGTPSPEVTGLICRVPERAFSRAPLDILLVYLCRFEVRFPTTLLRGFSWQRGIGSFQPYGLMLYASLLSPGGFAYRNQLTRIEPHSHRRSCLSLCVTPS